MIKNPLKTEPVRRAVYWVTHTARTLKKRLPHKKAEEPGIRRSLDWTGEGEDRQYAAFSLAPGAVLYAILLLTSFVFTQILRARASHIFFLFMVILLPVSFLYTWTARRFVRVYVADGAESVEKLQPYAYEIRILNTGIFAYPFVDAVVRLPRRDAVRTTRRQVRLSLLPFATYTVKSEVAFRFRGTYEVGVSCFYVYDFFRILRFRVDAQSFQTVLVLPRKRTMEKESAVAVSDVSKKTTRSPYAFDRTEVLDTREYRLGDSLKSIHWKLSSKAEELIVRDYSSGSSNRTVVYCDLSARFPETEPQEESALPLAEKKTAKQMRQERTAKLLAEQEKARKERAAARQKGVGSTLHGKDADAATEETEDPNIRAIAETDIGKRSAAHARTDRRMKFRRRENMELDAVPDTAPVQPTGFAAEAQKLAEPQYYADMNEFCIDGVMEIAISTVLRELRAGNGCTLLWFDSRAKRGLFAFDLAEEADFDTIFRLFATAPLCPKEDGVWKLRSALGDTQGIKQVFVSSALDPDAVAQFNNLPILAGGGNLGSAELVYYNPQTRFAQPTARRQYLESCRTLLAQNGITLLDGSDRLTPSVGEKEA